MPANPESPFGPDWVLLRDAVEMLGMSAKTIRRRVRRGLLKGRREDDRPNGRLWIRIPEDIGSQPATKVAAAQIEIRGLKGDLEEAKFWGAEQARLRADAEMRAEAATRARKTASEDAKVASERHSSERKRLEEDNEGLRLGLQEWHNYSVGVEKDRDDAEEARDRYRNLYESGEREIRSLRAAAQRHDSTVSALTGRDRKQNAQIRQLQDANKRLQAEPARLHKTINRYKLALDTSQNEVANERKFAGLLTFAGMVVSPIFLIFCLFLYLRLQAPIVLQITSIPKIWELW